MIEGQKHFDPWEQSKQWRAIAGNTVSGLAVHDLCELDNSVSVIPASTKVESKRNFTRAN